MGEKMEVYDVTLYDRETGEELFKLNSATVDAKIEYNTEKYSIPKFNIPQSIEFTPLDFKVNMVKIYQVLLGLSVQESIILNKLFQVKKRSKSGKEKVKADKRINKLMNKYKLKLR